MVICPAWLAVAVALSLSFADVSANLPQTSAKRQLQAPSASPSGTDYFVTVGSDLNFYLGCQPFFVAGWNQWEVVESGAGAPILYGASIPPGMTGPQLIRTAMDDAVANKLNVIRFFANAVDGPYTMETSPGVFNEAIFRGLDYALDQARQRGLKLILALLDNWSNPGGIDQLVAWSSTAKQRSDFFSDATCMTLYKQLVKAIITRVNTINGWTYSEDPTIMAWNLINEPRCNGCGPALQSWITTMAAYVRTLDTNQLLTVGEEGFYGGANVTKSDYANPEPPNSWAAQEGQDFVANHQVSGINFASMHLWPDNWDDDTLGFVNAWLAQHDQDGQNTLKMPVVLEEWGKWVKNTTNATQAQRVQFYEQVYNYVLQSAATGSVKGVAFWQWINPGQVAPAAEGFGEGLYGITTSDATWTTISSFAQSLSTLGTANCAFSKPSNLATPNSCSQTWVNGIAGSGYEGPNCNIDVNECVRGLDNCAQNANCINTVGSFSCQCYYGYTGNGVTNCTATALLANLPNAYNTTTAQLSCSQGVNVPYPRSAPGYVDDPTNATSNGTSSTLPVTALDCEIACETAPGCSSFAYNPIQQKCFLKNGGSTNTCPSSNATCVSSNQNLQPQDFNCGAYQTYFRKAGPVGAQLQASLLSATAG